ncbi:MAG TPA: carboxypeptidase regulatory-like domain-containing protein [Candidatus Polarisedimenticolia bacterium]|jgi:outer membrane receptor protein involved in Fe transport|nr:carboxypeptidase regulatory-like domain-containing protein [Candidatus Polarisedimenticolia bacterium]
MAKSLIRSCRRLFIPCLAWFLLGGSVAGAIAETPGLAALNGVVVDRDGSLLPGVTVVLENPALGVGPRGAVTSAKGEFRIVNVPPGTGFSIRASLPSYQTLVFHDVQLVPGENVFPGITLRPAIVQEERVKGTVDVVKPESATTSTTISSEFLSGLPILGRDYQDILTLVPGVTDVDNTGNPNIHGARDTDVVTLVDGVNTTDPFTGLYGQELNVESIQEIEVITAGATAEYSRAAGGFVKILTKSGGNEFKGTFKFFMQTSRLDGDGAGTDPTDVRGGLGERNGFRDQRFTDLYPFLSLSGAFIQDRLWYFFAPEYVQIEEPVNVGTHAFIAGTHAIRATAKTTWQMVPSNQLVFEILYDDTREDNNGLDSFTDLESGYEFHRGGPTTTLRDTATLSPNLSLETALSRFDQSFSVTPTLNPDTNGNGLLFVDGIRALGGNQDGFRNARERDPGEDYDRDGRYDIFEDVSGDGVLDGCENNPETGERYCFPPSGEYPGWYESKGFDLNDNRSLRDCPRNPDGSYDFDDPLCELDRNRRIHYGEDIDRDGQLTGPYGCEGKEREDVNCNGRIDFETDANENGIVDPAEDRGIPCSNRSLCPDGTEPGTGGNGRFDSEDRNGNDELDTLPGSGYTPFPFWEDRNGDHVAQRGEFHAPQFPDRDYVLSDNTNRISGPFYFDYTDSRTRDTLKSDLSAYVDDLLGSHDLKIGAVFEQESFERTTHQRPYLTVSTGFDPASGRNGGTVGTLLPTQGDVHNTAGGDHLGFYFQDTYKPLPNLSVNLGLRFDRESIHSEGFEFFEPAAQRREFDILMGLNGFEAAPRFADFNQDGVVNLGFTGDPLYSMVRYAQLESQLAEIAPRRFSRHNFLTSIESALLSQLNIHDPNLLRSGRPRQPQDVLITNNNLAPRLSLSWDPRSDGKSKVFASWGRYYGNLFLETVIGEEGPDLISPYYQYDADGVDLAGLPNNQIGKRISAPPPAATQVDRGMRTPFTDELSAGFYREIAPEVSLSLTYVRRAYRDLLQDIDVNHSVRKATATMCPGPDEHTLSGLCDNFGRTLGIRNNKGIEAIEADSYPDLFINNVNFNQIFRVGNYNSQAYHSYELQISRRLRRKWLMDASYVFSKATGQAETFLSENGDDPALTELKSGYLSYDQRHVARFNAVAFLPGDWQVGGSVNWSSGLPFSFVNRFQSGDNVQFTQTRRLFGYRDPNTGKFIPELRNAHRNHATYDLNVRAQKNLVLGKVSAGAFFELHNLLNSDALRVSEIDNRFRTLQSDETRRFGRRFQLGVQLDF